MEFLVKIEDVEKTGKYPIQATKPKSNGIDVVNFGGADFSKYPFAPLEPAVFAGGFLGGVTLQGINESEWLDLIFTGQIQVRSSSNNIFDECNFTANSASPIRFRFGSHSNTVTKCKFLRSNIPVTSDVVAIYFSDGPNKNNTVYDCTSYGYTDFVQVGNRAGTDYGHAEGLKIAKNEVYVLPEHKNKDGSMAEGLENAFDFKSGGTPENPVIVFRNQVGGYRPNSKTPGYAITIHNCATDIHFIENDFLDCEAGVFLNAQYQDMDPTKGWLNPRVKFVNNSWFQIKNHGFQSQWPNKQGSVVCGSNTAVFKHDKFYYCNKREEMQANNAVDPRMFENCLEHK